MRITANQVTIARLLAMPLLGALAYGEEQTRIFAVILGTLIGLTDTVDGYLARKHGTTVLGSLLDPVADKVFIVVCYGCCADLGMFSWAITAAILSRELLVTVSAFQPGAARPAAAELQRRQGEDLGADDGHRLRRADPDHAGPDGAGAAVRGAARRRPHRPGHRRVDPAAPLPAAGVRGRGADRVPVGVAAGRRAGGAHRRARIRRRDDLVHGARLPGGGRQGAGPARPAPLPALGAAAGGRGAARGRDAGVGTTRLPTVPLIILLSVEMARGALDNYAAHRRVTDFSWAGSLWGELVAARRPPSRCRRSAPT